MRRKSSSASIIKPIQNQFFELFYEVCRKDWRVTKVVFFDKNDTEMEIAMSPIDALERVQVALSVMTKKIDLSDAVEISYIEFMDKRDQKDFKKWNRENDMNLKTTLFRLND